MNISFDAQADAMYIQFQKGTVKKTLKIQDGILVDIGKNERLFGIEILDVSHRIPLKTIGKINLDLPVKVRA